MSIIFIVTSVIHTGTAPWSYTGTRSLFSPEQRLQQTLETFASIRRFCVGAKILVVEGGPLTAEERERLTAASDWFVDAYTKERTRQYCLESGKKGLGDAWLLSVGLDFLQTSVQERPHLIFKMSGRYRLNEQFNLANISDTVPTFRRIVGAGCVTFCFAVPGHMLDMYIQIMKGVVAMYCGNKNPSLEDYLPHQFAQIQEISCMGAEGQIAIDTSLSVYRV